MYQCFQFNNKNRYFIHSFIHTFNIRKIHILFFTFDYFQEGCYSLKTFNIVGSYMIKNCTTTIYVLYSNVKMDTINIQIAQNTKI